MESLQTEWSDSNRSGLTPIGRERLPFTGTAFRPPILGPRRLPRYGRPQRSFSCLGGAGRRCSLACTAAIDANTKGSILCNQGMVFYDFPTTTRIPV